MSCNIHQKRPIVRLVSIEGGQVDTHEYVSNPGHSTETRLVEIFRWVQSLLRTLDVETVVVRSPDYAGVKQKTETVVAKAEVEGILVAAAGLVASQVHHLSGKEIGAKCGSGKDAAEAAAAAAHGDKFKEAGAAAAAAEAIEAAVP